MRICFCLIHISAEAFAKIEKQNFSLLCAVFAAVKTLLFSA
jgi:hypothetical protein